jgi:hypothetical protein
MNINNIFANKLFKPYSAHPISRVPWRAHREPEITFYSSGFINFAVKRFQRMLSSPLFFEPPSFACQPQPFTPDLASCQLS